MADGCILSSRVYWLLGQGFTFGIEDKLHKTIRDHIIYNLQIGTALTSEQLWAFGSTCHDQKVQKCIIMQELWKCTCLVVLLKNLCHYPASSWVGKPLLCNYSTGLLPVHLSASWNPQSVLQWYIHCPCNRVTMHCLLKTTILFLQWNVVDKSLFFHWVSAKVHQLM